MKNQVIRSVLAGILLGITIAGALIMLDAKAAIILANESRNLYLDSCAALLFLTILLLREMALEKLKIANMDRQQRETEIILHDQKNRFEIIFEHNVMGIALINTDGHIIRVNQAICELLGHTQDELLAMNYYYLLPQMKAEELQLHVQKLLQDRVDVYQFEHEFCRKDNEALWVRAMLSLIQDQSGKPAYFILQLQNISVLKKAEDRLRQMAYHDALTGLANRNKLEQQMNHLLAYGRRHQKSFAVIFLDLDRFKNINDTIGHEAGDMLLQVIGERLRRSVRVTDLVARLGGDEFVLLIADINKSEDAAVIAKKVLENTMQAIVIHGNEIYITTSIGISLFPYDGQNIPTLMKNADLAMYRAKDHGRNNFQFYTHEMTAQAQEKLALQTAIGHALVKEEFLLHYQPIMNIQSGEITGVEALLRWNNTEYGMTSTDAIIALAEETGLIIPVSEWINKTACRQLKSWRDAGFGTVSMALNFSARQFRQVSYINELLSLVNEMGLSPDNLEIEVTESVIMQDEESMLKTLYALKDTGIKIVIDDFGTGYWSLGNLRRLSVDKIKIDKTFIRQMSTDETSRAIVSAIIGMVNRLGIVSVAEGVETRDEYEFLRNEGCVQIQGYYLARPLPAEAMTEFLRHPQPAGEAQTLLSESP